MTIARRLIILLAVPLLVLLGLGAFSRIQLAKVEARTRFAAETQVQSLAALGNISRSLTEMHPCPSPIRGQPRYRRQGP
jgi:CHASE3 domain sensor protein